MDIHTPRLKLINCSTEILKAILNGDVHLAKMCNIRLAEKWTEFGAPIFIWSLTQLKHNLTEAKWLTYLPVFKEENILIGSCGYKGNPNEEGIVEIGYEIAEGYRGRGFAKEAADALVRRAFETPVVKMVTAHTAAEINESGSVLTHCGFQKVSELNDPDDGLIWRWEISRREYENRK